MCRVGGLEVMRSHQIWCCVIWLVSVQCMYTNCICDQIYRCGIYRQGVSIEELITLPTAISCHLPYISEQKNTNWGSTAIPLWYMYYFYEYKLQFWSGNLPCLSFLYIFNVGFVCYVHTCSLYIFVAGVRDIEHAVIRFIHNCWTFKHYHISKLCF